MRSREGVYLVEGPVLVREALEAGLGIESLYLEESAADEHPVELARRRGVPCHLVRDGVLSKVLDQRSPRPLVAVVAQHGVGLAELVDRLVAGTGPLVVAVELADPGNAGTLVRVAEAAGCAGVVVAGDSVDVHNPKVVRASAGSLFRLPVAVVDRVDVVLRALVDAGVALVGTTGSRDVGGTVDPEPFDDADLAAPFALVLGNEARGLDEQVLGSCDRLVTIPMEGAVESLNAAVAGAVICFEAARQRRRLERSGGPGAGVGHNEGRPGPNMEERPDV